MMRLCARLALCLVFEGVHNLSSCHVVRNALRPSFCSGGGHLRLGSRREGGRLVCYSSLSESCGMDPRLERALSGRLWEGCRKQAMLGLYNPFVVALAAGKLEKASFQSYIAQDVFFLTAFSKAYGMALEHTDDPVATSSILSLQRDVDMELEMHSSYMEAWELSIVASRIVPNAATSAYTDFLLETAAGRNSGVVEKDVESFEMCSRTPGKYSRLAAFTIAAMTPCMRLYAFLGSQLKGYAPENIYKSWIDTYSSNDFQNSALQIEHLLDNLASACRVKDYETIETLYQRAMDLEVAFFNAQPICESLMRAPFFKPRSTDNAAEHIFTVVSDFDSTCTVGDSCPILAELTVSTAGGAEGEGAGQLSLVPPSELRSKWNALTELYVKDFSKHLEEVLASRQGLEGQYAYNAIRSALSTISEFEAKANKRVVDSGVLQGVELNKVRNAGRLMALRPGCRAFLERVRQEAHTSLSIVSVCWSQSFIEGCLGEGTDGITIYSNELEVMNGVSNGTIIQRVEHALDKEKILDQIVHDAAAQPASSTSRERLLVYVGDSVTDLLCLLKADIGIILGDSSTLQRFSAAFGVDIQPLFSAAVGKEKALGSCKTIYKASDWHEVQAFLWGD